MNSLGPLDLPFALREASQGSSDRENRSIAFELVAGSVTRFGTPEWVRTCQNMPKELGGRPRPTSASKAFRFSSLVEERHREDLYGAAFGQSNGLAVVGGRHVSIYVARGPPSFEMQLR